MKVHWLAQQDQVKRGSDVTALCGAFVPKVDFMMYIDFENHDVQHYGVRGTCLECEACKQKYEGGPRYLYAIMSGQELIEEAKHKSLVSVRAELHTKREP